MHAVVLAGGKGVRLRPYTTSLPKPLVPVGDRYAIIEVVLRQLSAAGFEHVHLAIGHLGQLIRAYCGDGHQWGLELHYWTEEEPLGTMGPVVAHLDELPKAFVVLNGDVLTDLDFAGLLTDHRASGALLSVPSYRREVLVDFGVLEPSEDGTTIVAFHEKPVSHVSVSMGVYGVSAAALAPYAAGVSMGFDDLVLDLLDAGTPPRLVPFDGFWLDIGRPEDYDAANADWPRLEPLLLPDPTLGPDRTTS